MAQGTHTLMLASEVFQHIEADLKGSLASEHDQFSALNYAARAMEASQQWRYLRRTRGDLKFRAPISATDASFVGTTATLSKVGLFAGYTLVPGDFVTLTLNGTAFGDFKITSRVDNDSITISDSPTAATFAGTVTLDVNTSRIALPSDVGSVVNVYGNINEAFYPLPYVDIAQLDGEHLVGASLAFGYALEWQTLTDLSAPTQLLKIWPERQSAKVNAAHVVYLRKWPTISSTDSVLPLPDYMEPLLLEYAKAYARGWDESDDVGQRLAAVEAGHQFRASTRADVRNAPQGAPIRNGAIRPRSPLYPQNRSAVSYFPTLGF